MLCGERLQLFPCFAHASRSVGKRRMDRGDLIRGPTFSPRDHRPVAMLAARVVHNVQSSVTHGADRFVGREETQFLSLHKMADAIRGRATSQ